MNTKGWLIYSRSYYLLSGKRYIFFNRKKRSDASINIDFVNNGGSSSFQLYEDEVLIKEISEPKTDFYSFEIKSGHQYKLVITSKKAKGKIKVRILKHVQK